MQDGGALFRTGNDSGIPPSAKMPMIKTPYEAAVCRAADVREVEGRLKELTEWPARVTEREA